MAFDSPRKRKAMNIVLSRLITLCKEAQKAVAQEVPLQIAVLRRIQEDLRLLTPSATGSSSNQGPNVWKTVSREDLPGLLSLHGLSMRLSDGAGSDEEEQQLYTSIRHELTVQLSEYLAGSPSLTTLKVLTSVLGSQSLRCQAKLLSQATRQLQLRPVARVKQAAAQLFGETCTMLLCFAQFLDAASGIASGLRTGVPSLVALLRRELAASSLLDHWARLLLALDGCHNYRNALAKEVVEFCVTVERLDFVMGRQTLVDGTFYLPRSPCLQYLLAAHVAQLCAALDGGTTFGLPANPPALSLITPYGKRLNLPGEVGIRLAVWALNQWGQVRPPLAMHRAAALELLPPGLPPALRAVLEQAKSIRQAVRSLQAWVRQRQEGQQQGPGGDGAGGDSLGLDAAALQALAGATQQAERRLRVPPFHTGATWRLAMRLAEAAVLADEQPPPPQPGRARLERVDAFMLAGAALGCSRQLLLHTEPGAGPAAPALAARQCGPGGAAAAAGTADWRLLAWRKLALRCAARALPSVGAKDFQAGSVGGLLTLSVPGSQGLPSCPSPDVAAAMEAGTVQLQEKLLRQCLAKDPALKHIWQLTHRYKDKLHDRSQNGAWLQVLAFGDPRVAASLIATVAKLLRKDALQLPACNVDMHSHGVISEQRAAAWQRLEGVMAMCAADGLDWLAAASRGADRSDTAAASRPQPSGGSCGAGAPRGAKSGADGAEPGPGPSSENREANAMHANAGGGGPGDMRQTASELADRPSEGTSSAPGPRARDHLRQLATLLPYTAAVLLPAMAALGEKLPMYTLVPGRDDGRIAALYASLLRWVPYLATAAAGAAAGSSPEVAAERHAHRAAAALSSAAGSCQYSPCAPAASAAGCSGTKPIGSCAAASIAGPSPPPAGASPPPAASACTDWARLLFDGLGVVSLLAFSTQVLAHDKCAALAAAYRAALRALCVHLPGELRAGMEAGPGPGAAAAAGPASAAGGSAAAAGPDAGPEQPAGSAAGGDTSAGPAAAAGGSAPAHASRARPALRLRLEHVRLVLGPAGPFPDPALLAELCALCGRGGGGRGGEAAGGEGSGAGCGLSVARSGDIGQAFMRGDGEEARGRWSRVAALLAPPRAAAALLPLCSNPACDNLAGDSEAALRLLGCGRCGGRLARYCRPECQRAHWPAHKRECGAAAGAGLEGPKGPVG